MPLLGKNKQTNQQPCCACVTSYDSTKMAGSTKASSQRAVVSGVLGVLSTLPTSINVIIFDILAISPKILCNKIHLTRFQNPRER